jgi:hypothetical protein
MINSGALPKVAPPSLLFEASMVPPWALIIVRLMERPMPKPSGTEQDHERLKELGKRMGSPTPCNDFLSLDQGPTSFLHRLLDALCLARSRLEAA